MLQSDENIVTSLFLVVNRTSGFERRKNRTHSEWLEDWLEYDQNEKFYKLAKIRKQRKPSESLRHPNLEYDDQEPDEDGLTFSSYHVLEW